MNQQDMPRRNRRLPPWLKNRGGLCDAVHNGKGRLRRHGLHTVCEEARCPNIGECFSNRTATYLILGPICTRRCAFCAIGRGGRTFPPDPEEPERLAIHAAEMKLAHVVVTSVTRDDLADGGASQFVATIKALRARSPSATVEVLTPDFKGSAEAIGIVCGERPDVFNHNIETVERLTPTMRDRASYEVSLAVIALARKRIPRGIIKSGLMLGLGERIAEVRQALRDLHAAGCDAVTIGQYLPPSRVSIPAAEYVHPRVFGEIERYGAEIGIRRVLAGPLVRSSYHADKVLID